MEFQEDLIPHSSRDFAPLELVEEKTIDWSKMQPWVLTQLKMVILKGFNKNYGLRYLTADQQAFRVC